MVTDDWRIRADTILSTDSQPRGGQGGKKVVWRRVAVKQIVVFLFLSSLSTGLHAQSVVPPGTVLPVRLTSSISSDTDKPGHSVTARLMQNVQLTGGSEIKRGAQVVGRLVKLAPSSKNSPARVVLIFDSLQLSGHTVPLRTSLRALAS